LGQTKINDNQIALSRKQKEFLELSPNLDKVNLTFFPLPD